ncbi:unnamed protein product [Phytophthora fragariaefolia]|uniref:Unnamed protein product n=1 Tax=Phytophthora fragariaefolia TaxID=1490495 RepID=A0A9W7CSD0_9STRA|nr:unnamed protein product [Phytophthora fragariaefolia]
MAEYDRGVQALLDIVKHREDEAAQLRAEVGEWRAAAAAVPPPVAKTTTSTQTETARPTKVASRRNSVRFAATEEGAASDKEEKERVDPETRRSIARMQVSSGDRRDLKRKATRQTRDHAEPTPHHSLKETILKRLGAIENKRKTTETQTEEIPIAASSTKLQQDLEERNRLLHDRLLSQQNVLDQPLDTKLKHANGRPDQHTSTPLQDTPVIPPDTAQVCTVKDPSSKPRCLAPNVVIPIDPTPTTERRPLSPPAA